jgi:thiamine biosynthesis lipoprotein
MGLLLIAELAHAEPPAVRFEYAQVHMGVKTRLVVWATDQAAAERACTAAFARIAELEQIMSDYRPDSELMRLCDRAGGEPVKVSRELLAILERAVDVSRRSNGAFDVTAGPAVRLWRAARKSGRLPSDADRQQALSLIGWERIRIDRERGTVQLTTPGMQLDLGGIAKGYAGDQALAMLREQGITSALFEAGGDIVVSDAPPGSAGGWAIDVPDADQGSGHRTVHQANCAISTSGDTEQFIEIGGVRYSHIVDPRTGMGVTGGGLVTVIAPDGTTADALATAISVMGAEEGAALIKQYPECTITVTSTAATQAGKQ